MFQADENGIRRCGPFRAAFLLDSLKELELDLRGKGSGLCFSLESPFTAIPRLAEEWNLACLLTSEEFGTEECQLLDSLQEILAKKGCRLIRTPRSYLLPEEQLPFAIEKVPDVFTAYRMKAEAVPLAPQTIPAPDHLHSPEIPRADFPALPELGIELPRPEARTAFPFGAGERAAQNRLQFYAQESGLLSVYKETRNGLIGADYSSKFSPWLAMGSLSAGQIYDAVFKYEQRSGANDSTRWLIFELRWRDFFRLMLRKHGSRLFALNGFRGIMPASIPSRELVRFRAWCRGETGNEFVDAGMRELKLTGFLSNRMRQVTASYLIDFLHLDWRLGAVWFEEQLVDYDVASNWGNWAYLAGVGSDPRGKRIFDPVRQAEHYDPDGAYRQLWLGR